MADKMSKVILPVKIENVVTPKEFDLADSYIEEVSEPYVSRTARDGIVKIPQLIGATVAWNQLVHNGNFADGTDNWIPTRATNSASNNVLTVTPTQNDPYVRQALSNNLIVSHKHLVRFTCNKSITCLLGGATSNRFSFSEGGTHNFIVNLNNTADFIDFRPMLFTDLNVYTLKNVAIFDLTQMFGPTIADYVYSLEQATEGSGMAWLKSYGFFTKDYYAYDAGSLQSVCTSARKITALDGSTRTYPIDNVQLRGLFKLDANNKLYCDGDIYPSSGSGTRKYGIVDLGSLSWQYSTTDPTNPFFHTGFPEKAIGNINIICSKYATSTDVPYTRDMADKTIKGYSSNKKLYIKDSSYTDLETFKNSLDDVYMVYELAEPTTFSADPYINPQRSEGTEEFVDGLTRDVMIPVGNESTYTVSETLSASAEYTDQQINNHNHDDRYVKLDDLVPLSKSEIEAICT